MKRGRGRFTIILRPLRPCGLPFAGLLVCGCLFSGRGMDAPRPNSPVPFIHFTKGGRPIGMAARGLGLARKRSGGSFHERRSPDEDGGEGIWGWKEEEWQHIPGLSTRQRLTLGRIADR